MSYTSKQTAPESQRLESGANKVVSPKFADQRASTSVQLKQQEMMSAVQRAEDEELLQGKFETAQRAEDEELLQGRFSNQSTTQLEEKPNNTGLPNQLKSGIESLSGMSLDNVKVHYNSDKPAQLHAHAYAQGNDIHVAPGQEQHLPHEAWHVVQQAQGRVKPTTQMKGTSVNDDAGLESEADVMGAKALSAAAQLMTDNSSLGREVINQLPTNEALQAKLDAALQLKPCAKHAWAGSKACPTCKVEKSNKNHNPRAGVSGGGTSASNSVAIDAFTMENKDGHTSRKELRRRFIELNS